MMNDGPWIANRTMQVERTDQLAGTNKSRKELLGSDVVSQQKVS